MSQDNLRHAQYGSDGVQVDSPQSLGFPAGLLGTYTWANRPSASGVPSGSLIQITDVPANSLSLWQSDGTYWRNIGPVTLLSNGNPGTTSSGASETVLASITIPESTLANNGEFVLEALTSYTNSANVKTFRFRIGGTGTNGTVLWQQTLTTTNKFALICGFQNRNATNSQTQSYVDFTSGYGATAVALLTSAVDTTSDFSVYLTGECASGAETITLQKISAKLL